MSFETFTPKRVATHEAKIAILPTGLFWINQVATRKFFDGFKKTVLLYDREKRIIGFRPTNKKKGVYCLSRAKSRNDSYVSGVALLKYFGIPKERRIYKPSYDKKKKIIEIDLNQPL